jgi:cytoskeletal protein CcmA (bactofilin family)
MSVFGKKEVTTVNPKAMNQLGQGTIIEGEINSDADIRIDGRVRGNVTSKGKIVLGATGIIDGDIRSENAYLEGRVTGRVEVADLLDSVQDLFRQWGYSDQKAGRRGRC